MRLSSQSRFYLFIFVILALLTTYAGCGGRDLMGDTKSFLARLFGPATPRTAHRKTMMKEGWATELEIEVWDKAYEVAKTTPLKVKLPHREAIRLDDQLVLSAQSFRLHLPAGRLLKINARGGGELFGELFRFKSGTPNQRPAEYFSATGANQITYETPWLHGEELLFVLQTPAGEPADYEVELTTEPTLLFPVEGDGEITRLTNTGIGGKTVWLYDRERDLRYYYAHLDEQLVRKGQRVRRGDVVGTVGNTGNARTTPPHLHFGIYDDGAIDPYPFLQRTDAVPAASRLKLDGRAVEKKVPARGNHYLRFTPEGDGEVIRKLDNGESIIRLGATGRFYRIKTGRGEVGYANFD